MTRNFRYTFYNNKLQTSKQHVVVLLYVIVVLIYVLFVSYRSMYCLCVNVYCTSATAGQPNCS